MSACKVGDPGLIPGLGWSPGEGNSIPLQYSCLENPMDWRAGQLTAHGVAKSQTGPRDPARTPLWAWPYSETTVFADAIQWRWGHQGGSWARMTGVWVRRGEQAPDRHTEGRQRGETRVRTGEGPGDVPTSLATPRIANNRRSWKRQEEPSLQISEGATALPTPWPWLWPPDLWGSTCQPHRCVPFTHQPWQTNRGGKQYSSPAQCSLV